jgi:hypothetical protein
MFRCPSPNSAVGASEKRSLQAHASSYPMLAKPERLIECLLSGEADI